MDESQSYLKLSVTRLLSLRDWLWRILYTEATLTRELPWIYGNYGNGKPSFTYLRHMIWIKPKSRHLITYYNWQLEQVLCLYAWWAEMTKKYTWSENGFWTNEIIKSGQYAP